MKLEACFSPGDLMYGLGDVREKAIYFLEDKDVLEEGLVRTIDEYNLCFLEYTHSKWTKNSHPLAYVESQNFPKDFLEVQNFHFFAKKFEVEKGKEDRSSGTLTYYKVPAIYGQGEMVPLIKKRCKLGILWNLQQGRKIHFFLDDIDLKQCFGKSKPGYTSSELRFVYRNWAYLSQWHKEGGIKFWRKSEDGYVEVSPPWLDKASSASCAIYKPKNPDRYQAFFAAEGEKEKKLSGIEEKKRSVPPAPKVDEKRLSSIKKFSEEKLVKYASKPRIFKWGPSHKDEATALNKFIQAARSFTEILEKLEGEMRKFSGESDKKGYYDILGDLFLAVSPYQKYEVDACAAYAM